MTQTEYEQKKRECWEDFRTHVVCGTDNPKGWFERAFDRAYALGKQEKDADTDKTIKINKQTFCYLCAEADDYINEHLEEDDSDYGYYKGRSDALHELYDVEPKDAEGEEMLTVPRKKVQDIYAQCEEIEMDDSPNLSADIIGAAGAKMGLLEDLFGSKCLPDNVDTSEPNIDSSQGNVDSLSQNSPENCDTENHISTDCDKKNFKKGDKVKVIGVSNQIVFPLLNEVGEIIDIDINRSRKYYVCFHLRRVQIWVNGCDLELYTEPKETILQPFCQSLESAASTEPKETIAENSNSSQDCDKHFDNVLKDSFSKERRLNIAAMATLGILSNESRMKRYEGMAATEPRENLTEIVARNAMRYADALISESEKYISVEKLKRILRALVAEGAIEPITMSVDEIINKIKKSI